MNRPNVIQLILAACALILPASCKDKDGMRGLSGDDKTAQKKETREHTRISPNTKKRSIRENIEANSKTVCRIVGHLTVSYGELSDFFDGLPSAAAMAALAPFDVNLFKVNNKSLKVVKTKRTGGDNFTFFGRFSVGDYRVECFSPIHQVYGREDFSIASTTTRKATEVILKRDVFPYRIFGRVYVGDDPAKSKEVTMEIEYQDGTQTSWDLITDDKGSYSHRTFGSNQFNAKIHCATALPCSEKFAMRPGVYEFKKDIFLRKSPIYAGVVVTPWGQPVKYAKLEFEGKEPAKSKISTVHAYTIRDGSFLLTGCVPGQYNVRLTKLGWNNKSGKVQLIGKNLGVTTLDRSDENYKFVVDTGKSLTFEVRNTMGERCLDNFVLLQLEYANGLQKIFFEKGFPRRTTVFRLEFYDYLRKMYNPGTYKRNQGRLSISWFPNNCDRIQVTCLSRSAVAPGYSQQRTRIFKQKEVLLSLQLKPGIGFRSICEDWDLEPIKGVELYYNIMEGNRRLGHARQGEYLSSNEEGEVSVNIYPIVHYALVSAEIIYEFPGGMKLRLSDPYRYKKYLPITIRPPVKEGIMGCIFAKDTGDPISGVNVIAEVEGFEKTSSKTDERGWFKVSSKGAGRKVRLEASKAGYKTYEFETEQHTEELILIGLESEGLKDSKKQRRPGYQERN